MTAAKILVAGPVIALDRAEQLAHIACLLDGCRPTPREIELRAQYIRARAAEQEV